MKKTANWLRERKAAGEKLAVLTCYDYPSALWLEAAGVDVVFVGDSVGTNVLGYDSEREVTMDDMLHHLKAVRRGVRQAYLLTTYRTAPATRPTRPWRTPCAWPPWGRMGPSWRASIRRL